MLSSTKLCWFVVTTMQGQYLNVIYRPSVYSFVLKKDGLLRSHELVFFSIPIHTCSTQESGLVIY